MTEKRLSEIALEMEEPLAQLEELENLLIEMVDQCRPDPDLASQSKLYSFFRRNLGGDLGELHKLWQEFYALTCEKDDKSPPKATKE